MVLTPTLNITAFMCKETEYTAVV